jgi:Flp pilus assembly protein TadB
MSPIGSLVVLTAIGVGGLLMATVGWLQPAPSLKRTIERLQRPSSAHASVEGARGAWRRSRPVSALVRSVSTRSRLLPTTAQLRLLGRPLDQHVVFLFVAAVVGFVGPPLVLAVLQGIGVVSFGWFVPVVAAIGTAVLGPLFVHTVTVERASVMLADLRYQVSAYLDVVTMLLAGNTGYEGALEQAAHAGDGRLFAELRRKMRESGARGHSLTDALERAGRELGLDELEQIAATAALSAAEGAPVARTLAAKCATLRAALSAEQESEARLRTSRLTTPIVGMALIFMALVIYPALSLS